LVGHDLLRKRPAGAFKVRAATCTAARYGSAL
jgi:hypothetical protein